MVGFILLFGSSVLWIASSSWGIGYDPDSIIYEDVAENWLDGQGITRYDFATGERYPMSNFPPLYPIALGLLSQINDNLAQSARLLNTVLWGIVWLFVYRWIMHGGQSHIIAWSVATLLMINLLVFQVFGTSWSEPMFIALGLTGLWFVHRYRQLHHRKPLIIAAIFLALAILTRYAGVALVMTATIMIWTSVSTRRRQLEDTIILGLISGMPLFIWVARNLILRGDIAARDVHFTMFGIPQLESSVATLGQWLIPIPEMRVNVIIIGLITLLIVLTFLNTRQNAIRADTGITLMRWWITIYLLFVIASFMIIDPRIPFNYRILFPAYVGLMILTGRWLAIRWQATAYYLRITWIVVGLSLLFVNGLLAINWAMIIQSNGHQYSDARFQQSQILQDLRDTDLSNITLYTNNNFLLHYQTDKAALLLPSASSTDFDLWLNTVSDDEPIQIVYFTLLPQRDWISTEQIESLLPVMPIRQSDIVTIYELDVSDE